MFAVSVLALEFSLNQIAKLIGVDSSNFSAFVNQRAGLSATLVCRLIELLGASKRQLELKLNAKPIQIRHFQSDGEPMRLDVGGAWVAVEGSSDDPNNTTGIDNTWGANGAPSDRVLGFGAVKICRDGFA